MKPYLISAVLLFSYPQDLVAQKFRWGEFIFKPGDLLFQDTDCGELCAAIKRVTISAKGHQFSHVGLVYIKRNTAYVIEAIGRDVHLTPLEEFIKRSVDNTGKFKIAVGRVKGQFQKLVKPALRFSLAQLGTPYDEAFDYANGKYYCSELIHDAFLFANGNHPFFALQPMTFNNPTTGACFEIWEKYFNTLHLPIPEGEPGCNPGGLSCSDKINIIKSFY
jgi:uncharacterized protein YycO